MGSENKYNIQDLDEYICQGEPGQRERAIAWQTALGLQAVDGLKTDDNHGKADDKPTITDDKLTSIRAFLKQNGPCRRKEISAMLGLKPTQTKAYLYKLLEQGKIVAHGANRNRTYSLA